ncbi:MAG: hypothetical protein COV45_04965 [Deltaproteobacteria bacterium CG11_big_fil_rev_8_21_14_0_20_47_16]|nr:MAG: hypothetical protein COV45_04965 [Deltaproteobacteria bacterium CG11_big_fil_rev_8_21_14_0_20_47_16]
MLDYLLTMSLTLWTEHGNGYRSPTFFKRIAQSLSNSKKPARYIVPNLAMKRRAEALCMTEGILFGPCILSHMEWCTTLADDTWPQISDAHRRHIIIELISTLPLAYFHPTPPLHGLADILIQGIASALHANLNPKTLAILAKEFGQEREQDLSLVFEAYLDRLHKATLRDTHQHPQLALEHLQNNSTITDHRLILDMGMQPMPILWEILRVINQQSDCDLHVIAPEHLRFTAESRLATEAREISSDEWIHRNTATQHLIQAPNVTAEYRWAASLLSKLVSQKSADQVRVITTHNDPFLWWDHCKDNGLLPKTPLPVSLSNSPLSAPWYDSQTWEEAPQSQELKEWHRWWQNRLYPEQRVSDLQKHLPRNPYAARALDTIAQWEYRWTQSRALFGDTTSLTQDALQNMIEPMLQSSAHISEREFPYTPSTLHDFLGDPVEAIVILDATQSAFPSITASPFFRRAAFFPTDPNTTQLQDAFPNADNLLAQALASWTRLQGIASEVTGIFSGTSDSGSEQLPSLLFDAEKQNISIEMPTAQTKTNPLPSTLLQAPDTIAHVHSRYQHHQFSVTELETFSACTFRHFAKYILNISIPDEDTPELQAKDEGGLIHRLLERYYKETPNTAPDRKQLEQLLQQLLPTPTTLQRIQMDQILTVALSAIQFDQAERSRHASAALTPTHFEWSFGKDPQAVTIHDSLGHSIQVQGKIDRIDIDPKTQRMLIMDYKFKKTGSVIADIKNGRHLQLPIYVLAAQTIFPDYRILGALLFDLKLTQRSYGIAHRSEAEFLGISTRLKSLIKEDDWDGLIQTATDHALRYAQTISSGTIPIQDHQCEYCDWLGLLPWEYQSVKR